MLGLADAPAAISAWLDVADDLALIVWVHGEPRRWATVVTRLRDRVGATRELGALGLTPVLAASIVRRDRSGAAITVVVPPARLRRSVARALEHLRPPRPPVGSSR